MIHLWSHDIGAATGGIQSYTIALARALDTLLKPEPLKVCLKHERARPLQLPAGIALRAFGSVPKRIRTAAFAAGAAATALWDRPRLILSCHPNFAPVGTALRRAISAPFWTAAHGIDVWEDCPRRTAAALKNCDRILAVSHFTKRKLIGLHSVDETRISVLPNTFDAVRFRRGTGPRGLREELGLPRESPLLLSVGRLAEPARMKGFDRVIQAMPRILEHVPAAYCLIAGTGPDLPRLRTLAAECGIAERVRFLGFVPDERLPACYDACDAFILPSQREGFGIVFLEALACGAPVIAGNTDASSEAVLGGELGILVNPDSIEEIADACVRLLSRSRVRPELLDRAHLAHRVTQAFGPATFADALKGLLEAFAPLPPSAAAETTRATRAA